MITVLDILLFTLLTAIGVTDVECNFKFLLLHTNGMHSNYKEVNKYVLWCSQPSVNCYGGFARIRAAVRSFTEQAKTKGMPTVYLDAGDFTGGTVFHMEYKLQMATKMMKLLQPQAMALGDNEFHSDINSLSLFTQQVEVPIVGCNIDATKEPGLKIKPSTVVTIGDEPNRAKVGILGYIEEDLMTKVDSKIKIKNVIESVKNEAKRLRKREQVNIIIAIGHAKYETNQNVAREVEDIDIIVGGHSNVFLYNGWFPQERVNGPYPTLVTPKYELSKRIPVVEAFHGTKYLGYLELEFDPEWRLKNYKGNPILLEGSMKQDSEVLDAMKDEMENVDRKYNIKIGYTEITLNNENDNCQLTECNIGNMITDAFVDYAQNSFPLVNGGPVIGLMPGKAIRGSLFANTYEGYTGDIMMADLVKALPSIHNVLRVVKMKGSDLEFILNQSMDGFEQTSGHGSDLLQVSGLRLKYDLTKRNRLVSAQVAPNYEDLNGDKEYFIVMTDILVHNKEYGISKKSSVISTTAIEDLQAVKTFIEKNKVFTKRGKYSKPDGRITIYTYSWRELYRIKAINFLSRMNPANGLYG